MARVIAGMAVSLDGYANDITGSLERLYPDLEALRATDYLRESMETTGAAKHIADSFIAWGGSNPLIALVVIYGLTMIFTEIMSNNAAAALMFPISMAAASALGVNHMPFLVAIMIAASCGFATPIGYQTNLMVYGPGGYRWADYIRFGVPLSLLVGVAAVFILPAVWPF